MRIVLLLGAVVAVVAASYGNGAAASPGYGAPPATDGPYQGPAQQVPHNYAPYEFLYDGSSSSSSSSSSESSSSSSESSEENESPTSGKCHNNLTSWEACPPYYQPLLEMGGIECVKPTLKPIKLRDGAQRMSVVCGTSIETQELFIIGEGPLFLAHGTGTQETIVTCHSSNVWSGIGGSDPDSGMGKVFFTNVWCIKKKPETGGGRRRRHVSQTASGEDLPGNNNTDANSEKLPSGFSLSPPRIDDSAESVTEANEQV